MAISVSDALKFLLAQKRDYERAAREARERGGVDHLAEARIQLFQDVADLIETNLAKSVE